MTDNVVLVNPPSMSSRERQYSRASYPRLGLGYLAAYLEKEGIAVGVVDAKLEGLNAHQVMAKVMDAQPQLVGITAFTPEIVDAHGLALELKRKLPRASIVVGGPHATVLPRETLQEFPALNFLVFGEGEATLYELVLALRGEKKCQDIPGLAFRDGDTIHLNPPRPAHPNLDELPFPAWHLFPRAERYPILASRGCPFQCIFCNRILGSRLRLRSPEKVIDEMELTWEHFRPRAFSFYDETFGVNRRHTYQLLEGIIHRGLASKVVWDIQTRVDVADLELLQAMKAAGCVRVGLGIESGNPQVLERSQKGITLAQAKRAVGWARQAGLETAGFFILGHPNETRKSLWDTISFAARLNPVVVNFGIMVPYPGTEVARMAEAGEGNYRLRSRRWEDYGKQVGGALEMKGIPRWELELWQLLGYIWFYLCHPNPSRLRHLAKFLRPAVLGDYVKNLVRHWKGR